MDCLKRCSHCARHQTTALDALTHDVGRLNDSYDVVRSVNTALVLAVGEVMAAAGIRSIG